MIRLTRNPQRPAPLPEGPARVVIVFSSQWGSLSVTMSETRGAVASTLSVQSTVGRSTVLADSRFPTPETGKRFLGEQPTGVREGYRPYPKRD